MLRKKLGKEVQAPKATPAATNNPPLNNSQKPPFMKPSGAPTINAAKISQVFMAK